MLIRIVPRTQNGTNWNEKELSLRQEFEKGADSSTKADISREQFNTYLEKH